MADELASLLFDFEQRFSRFREDSLLSQLNRNRSLVSDDADLRAMLQQGLWAEELSEGYFSLWVGSVLISLGYGKSQASTTSAHATEKKEKKLMLDAEQSLIQLE